VIFQSNAQVKVDLEQAIMHKKYHKNLKLLSGLFLGQSEK